MPYLYFALVFCATACATAVPLHIEPSAARDQTATARNPTGQVVRSVMILARPSPNRSVGVSELSELERSVLGAGVDIIASAAPSSFAPQGASSSSPGAAAADATPEDLEHALTLARNANVDALLEVAALDWSKETRWFGLNEAGRLEELDQEKAARADIAADLLVHVRGAVLNLKARLISVKQGRLLASFEVSQSTIAIAPVTEEIGHELARPVLATGGVARRKQVVLQVSDTLIKRLSEYAPQSAVPLPGQERSWR